MTLILLLLRRTISFTSILLLISLHFNSSRWGCHTRPFIAHIANTISSFTFRCRQLYFVILHKHISKNSAFDSVVHYSIQKRINTSVSESKTQRSNKCLRRNVHGICHPISLNQYKDYENRQPHHKKQEYEQYQVFNKPNISLFSRLYRSGGDCFDGVSRSPKFSKDSAII